VMISVWVKYCMYGLCQFEVNGVSDVDGGPLRRVSRQCGVGSLNEGDEE